MGAKEATGIAKILEQAGLGKGKILDLACGIGRHSIPLARMGTTSSASTSPPCS